MSTIQKTWKHYPQTQRTNTGHGIHFSFTTAVMTQLPEGGVKPLTPNARSKAQEISHTWRIQFMKHVDPRLLRPLKPTGRSTGIGRMVDFFSIAPLSARSGAQDPGSAEEPSLFRFPPAAAAGPPAGAAADGSACVAAILAVCVNTSVSQSLNTKLFPMEDD